MNNQGNQAAANPPGAANNPPAANVPPAGNAPPAANPLPLVLTPDDHAYLDLFDDTVKQGHNGGGTYSQHKALFSHLPAGYRMIIPSGMAGFIGAGSGWDIGLADLGKNGGYDMFSNLTVAERDAYGEYCLDVPSIELVKMLMMNFHALTSAPEPLSMLDAYLASAYRVRWVMLGALGIVEDNARLDEMDDEHVYVDNTCADQTLLNIDLATTPTEAETALGANHATLKNMMADETYGLQWITMTADNVWASVEHTFRTKSHHFKTQGGERSVFENLYRKFLQACNEGNFDFPANADMFHIMHTAIHPFRIASLPKMVAKFVAYGTIAPAAIIRLSAAPTGNAIVTTTYAALGSMSGESWYQDFERLYGKKIVFLNKAREVILDDKFSYHMGARLYGVNGVTTVTIDGVVHTLGDVKTEITALAAAGRGFMQALENAVNNDLIEGFALSNAKSLNKPARAEPMVAIKVKTIVEKEVEAIVEAENSKLAISSAFPRLTDGKAQVATAQTNNANQAN